MTRPHAVVVVALALTLGLAGCAPAVDGAADPAASAPEAGAAPEEVVAAETFMASLNDLGGTEWTGLDETFNDRITFIFATDGTVSYRTAEGNFADPADTWSVDGDTVVFQASYGGSFGIGTHTGTYDPATGVLVVEYTTTTNRQSSYTLSQVD